MSSQDHWNNVYQTKSDEQVSWFEPVPSISLQMLNAAGLTEDSCVVDIGGGDSRVVDHLIEQGLECVAVLDVSAAALCRARHRLATAADVPKWIEPDVTGDWQLEPMDIWHDRAVFHFLTLPAARPRYKAHLLATVKRGGGVVIATFALDGPQHCSGLPVARYSPQSLSDELGAELNLVESMPYVHKTPWGTAQAFQYSRFTRL